MQLNRLIVTLPSLVRCIYIYIYVYGFFPKYSSHTSLSRLRFPFLRLNHGAETLLVFEDVLGNREKRNKSKKKKIFK